MNSDDKDKSSEGSKGAATPVPGILRTPSATTNFIKTIIDEDNTTGKYGGKVLTRFPPEPNGYLHIGHAKSICLNFGLAKEYGGLCNLRFDDTNPSKEEVEYVDSIMEDVRWLGFDWSAGSSGQNRLFYASDYFEKLYEFAIQLIKKGVAYVDDLTADQIREYRGTLTAPGKESPYRNRSVEENLDLFERMRKGEFPNGAKTLRAKIDMTSPNLNMRDPVMCRILHESHHRTGDQWCIYPMYDWAHGQSDSIEGITHSICTLEFEDHRPLYDWFVEQLGIHHPRQIEFARLNLTYTLMSKRKLLTLVQEGIVAGWDDPRMPTISGLRRRGFTPESIRDFAERIGVAKRDSIVDYALLEHCLREDLNRRAMRVMSVLRPLKLIIDNYPEGKVEEVEAVNNPEDPGAGTRKLPFSRELYVERDDFQETPHKKWFRLAPGSEVRLKHGYIIKCVGFEKDPNTGEVTELHATYDPATRSAPMAGAALSEAGRSGESTDGHQGPADRKVKGTLHWVSAAHAAEAEVRLYDHLFTKEAPDSDPDFRVNLNPHSLEVLRGARIEPGLKNAKPGDRFQFLRHGYFCVDTRESRPGASAVSGGPVFNRTTSLRDTWAKIEGK